MSVEIPKVAIAFGSITPPQGDVIELRVHLGCTKEVGSFECLLQNWNKKYSLGGTSPINVGMDGHIDIGRGTNVPQIITFRVESVKYESTPAENYVRVSGRCWGERIFRRVVTKVYENKKGEDVARDLADYYFGLDHCRTNSALTSDAASGQKNCVVADGPIFSVGMLVKIQDSNAWEYNEVASVLGNTVTMVNNLANTYTVLANGKVWIDLVEKMDTTYTKLEYENTPVWDILKYVAESSDKAGIIGFDFRVAPDGKFEFFPKNSKTSSVNLSEKIEISEYRKDIHRIRNKVMVYGLADKSVPVDKDAWTESLTPSDGSWSAAAGEVSLDTGFKVRGSASIKVYGQNLYWAGAIFTLNAGKEVDANKYPILSFYAYLEKAYDGNVGILLSDAANKEAGKHITIAPDEWRKTDLKVGLANEIEWEWVDTGFDWSQIKKIRIDGWFAGVGTGNFWIDALYFGGRRYEAAREDSGSQNAYGLRELTETDEELISDNECDLRVKALLDYFKNPAEYLTIRSTVIDYGNTPLLPGDKIHVTLPNENVDADFRIESVEYYVDARTQVLEIRLELGKVPPLLADYLYGMRATTVTVEKLARTKLGKKGIPTVQYGGGLGSHHVGHETGGEDGQQWPNQDDGGWDKLAGWISPKHIGPFDEAAAIIKFRTKNKAGTAALDHQFQPSDDGRGTLGSENAKWKEVHTFYLLLYTDGYMRIKTVGESNPRAQLSSDMLQFGPGGDSALDAWFKHVGAGQLELRYDLFPPADNTGNIGSSVKRWAHIHAVEIHVSNMLFNFHVIPDADATYDLGSSTKRWSNLYVSGLASLGWLDIANYTVITSARVLQNVTADVGIITSGQFPLARLPRGTSGYVLEAQGANFDPMYVNPNGRYTPAGHIHAAGDVTSGVFAEDRIPHVYANGMTFDGGVTMGAGLNMNTQAITNLASLNQAMPPAANSGSVGTTTTYWNCIAGNSVWYKALGQFDVLDDLAIIKRIRGNGKVDERGMPLSDPESLPPEVTENGLINAGALTGLLIGAVKQLAAKVESLDKELKKVKAGVAA